MTFLSRVLQIFFGTDVGKRVKIPCGPAAVIGDESRIATVRDRLEKAGKSEEEEG